MIDAIVAGDIDMLGGIISHNLCFFLEVCIEL